MNLTLILLAAAISLAPWRGRAVERLVGVIAADSAGSPAAIPVPAPGNGIRGRLEILASALPVSARVPGRRAEVDPGALAQLVDLLAAALTAGLPASGALGAVADAVAHSHPAAVAPLRVVAARLGLGATPAEAWQDVPGADPLRPVLAVLVRATEGGGSVRAALDHAAGRLRAEADAAATARAERASVLVAGPLGLCFLPAFVCLGVLPVVVGLADGMLPGTGL